MSREYPCKLYRIEAGDRLRVELDLGFEISIKQSIRLTGVKVPEARGTHRASGLHITEYVSSWFEENADNGDWPFIAYIIRDSNVWSAEVFALDKALSLNDHIIQLGWGNN